MNPLHAQICSFAAVTGWRHCAVTSHRKKRWTVTKQGRDREYFICLMCFVGIKYSSLCSPFSLFTCTAPSELHLFFTLFSTSLSSLFLYSTPCVPTYIHRGCLRPYIPFQHLLQLPYVESCNCLDFTGSPSTLFGTITILEPRESRAKENVWLKSCADYIAMSNNGIRQLYGLRAPVYIRRRVVSHQPTTPLTCSVYHIFPFFTSATWDGPILIFHAGVREKRPLPERCL